jgi:hypothetical protein
MLTYQKSGRKKGDRPEWPSASIAAVRMAFPLSARGRHPKKGDFGAQWLAYAFAPSPGSQESHKTLNKQLSLDIISHVNHKGGYFMQKKKLNAKQKVSAKAGFN